MPHVEVRSRRVGGATFQINANSSRQKNFYGMKWLINIQEERKSMAQEISKRMFSCG
jgi:ribosomal protein S7